MVSHWPCRLITRVSRLQKSEIFPTGVVIYYGRKMGTADVVNEKCGLNSGFMIPQYTTAALVTENKTLCFPASADSIPTSLGQEDHVSMGSISGRKLNKVLDNLEYILAIELLTACQAIEFSSAIKKQ
jgi:histidine ammonia-lyase